MELVSQVKAHVERQFGHPDRVESDDNSACTVYIDNMAIKLSLDIRDNAVSSSVKFLNENIEEDIDLRIVSKLYSNITWQSKKLDSINDYVEQEISNIRNVLDISREQGVSARDMIYFYTGYSTAYTEYYSR